MNSKKDAEPMTRSKGSDPSVKGVLIGIAVTAAMTVGCLIIAALLSHQALDHAVSSPSEQGAVFVHPIRDNDAGVRQRPILDDHPAYLRQRAQRERLKSFGWVDRAQGRAHIPIDAAMGLMLARKMAERHHEPTEEGTHAP